MSSRNCGACLGTGEKPKMGHMPPYKCNKCGGSGIIHNFNAIVKEGQTPLDSSHDPLSDIVHAEEKRLEIQMAPEPKKRGRPSKIG